MKKFAPDWEPTLLTEEVVASGTWWYQDKVPYTAELIKQRYDYTSKDLVTLDEILEIPNIDYIDYSISDEGVIYFWRFTNGDNKTFSDSFSTYFTARDHINTYGGKYEIKWN